MSADTWITGLVGLGGVGIGGGLQLWGQRVAAKQDADRARDDRLFAEEDRNAAAKRDAYLSLIDSIEEASQQISIEQGRWLDGTRPGLNAEHLRRESAKILGGVRRARSTVEMYGSPEVRDLALRTQKRLVAGLEQIQGRVVLLGEDPMREQNPIPELYRYIRKELGTPEEGPGALS